MLVFIHFDTLSHTCNGTKTLSHHINRLGTSEHPHPRQISIIAVPTTDKVTQATIEGSSQQLTLKVTLK